MQVWNVLHAARWNTGRKKSPKIRHLRIIAQICRAISWQLRHVSTIGKCVKQQYLLHTSSQYGELRPTSGWDRSGSLGHPANFNGFRVLAALLHGILVVGVSQTLRRWTEGAIFGRAAITLGIGPHSSYAIFCVLRYVCSLCCSLLRRFRLLIRTCFMSHARPWSNFQRSILCVSTTSSSKHL